MNWKFSARQSDPMRNGEMKRSIRAQSNRLDWDSGKDDTNV
ncbi:hypothetical protein D8I24_0064 (plasmid) [Cupriavidus necator H850]|nr:hypothetical protein D8I24_0064 [Cupriavidus necator H850]